MPGRHHGVATWVVALVLGVAAPVRSAASEPPAVTAASPQPSTSQPLRAAPQPPTAQQEPTVQLPPPALAPVRLAPCDAVVRVAEAYVRAGPDARATVVGVVKRGARVRVRACVPEDCARKGAWALLEGDGAVRWSYLIGMDDPAVPPPPPPHLVHFGIRGSAQLRARPDARARVLVNVEGPTVLALLPPATEDAAWLQHPSGGWVARAQLRALKASTLAGEVEPTVPLAFLVRDVKQKGPDGTTRVLPRHLRLPVLAVEPATVHVTDAVLPRAHVRLAWARVRPAGVPAGARWVHVDTTEQVLTAYEGDRLVFATLVSTGMRDMPTRQGLFRVWLKSQDERMHGADYDVEEVPAVHYFSGGQGLHGSSWHQRFGSAVSHGCVNLAPADAAWLMAWAPPELPRGWHTVVPSDGRTTLRVQVEATKRVARWEPAPKLAKP